MKVSGVPQWIAASEHPFDLEWWRQRVVHFVAPQTFQLVVHNAHTPQVSPTTHHIFSYRGTKSIYEEKKKLQMNKLILTVLSSVIQL